MGTSIAEPVAAAAAVTNPAPAADPTPAAEVTYDLKLPELDAGVKDLIDPDILTRTAAIARERGLTPEAAQSALDFTIAEAKSVAEKSAALTAKAAEDAVKAANETFLAANQPPKDGKPGGEEWVKRNTGWWNQSLADPELGGGKKEQLSMTVERANQAVARFGPGLKPLLEQSGLGSHPEVLRFLANVGKAAAEPSLVTGGTTTAPRKAPEDLLYDNPTSQKQPAA